MAAPGSASAGNNGTTTASITVPQTLAFYGLTSSITFTAPPALPGAALNNPQKVDFFASTNDPKGASVSVTASGDFTGTGPGNHIPINALSLNNTPFPESNPTLAADTVQPVIINEIEDAYSLFVPNVAPDTYTATLTYTATDN